LTITLPRTDTMGAAELRQLIHEDPTVRILDVRTGGEFETVHIPGSYNVPLDTLREHVGELAGVDRPVVLVCQSGGRATQAHQKLSSAGKDSICILEGGMTAWQAADGDVVRGSSDRWAMDRQVRLAAGSMVVAGVLASVVVPKAKWLSAGVAGGLVASAVSNTCPMASALSRLPYNRTDSCDIAGVLEGLNGEAA
jgi:rhodanese-related sulfurtransferase